MFVRVSKWQPTPVFLPGESQGGGAWWAAVYRVAQSRTRLKRLSSILRASLVAETVQNLPVMPEKKARSLGQEDPQKRKRQPTPEFLPGEFQGQRSLAGYSA